MNFKEAQQIYLGHYKRSKALGLKPMALSAFYDACFDPIIIPTFIKRHV